MKVLRTLAVLAVVAVAPASAAEAKAPARCSAGPGKTVTRTTAAVRILRLSSGAIRVCSRTTWRSRVLNPYPDSQSSTILAIRGRYVADQLFLTQREDEYAIKVRVLDARSGRFRIDTDAFHGSCCIHPASANPSRGVRSAAIGPGGSVAWITSRLASDPALDVRYSAGGGSSQLLDSDPTVEPGSIAMGAGYVFWQRADGARSARV